MEESKYIKIKNKHLEFDGVDIDNLAQTYQTPFFLFSERILQDNYSSFFSSFSKQYKNFQVYYSVKTNHELSVLKILANLGSGGEISCAHELYIALKAGMDPKKICFDGPSKTRQDIEYAVKEGIHIYNAESMEEAIGLNRIAKKLKKKIKVGFRIDPDMKSFRSSWVERFIHKFGIEEKEAIDAYKAARKLTNLDAIGIHAHIGSQNTSSYPYTTTIKAFSKINKELLKYGVALSEFNIGGGFPSSSLNKSTIISLFMKFLGIKITNKVPSIDYFTEKITDEFREKILPYCKNKPLLATEPGRSITSTMGILVTKVKRIKDDWIFLDATMKSIPESLFFAEKEIMPAKVKDSNNQVFYNISGASLSTSDIFFLKKKLPKVSENDTIAIFDGGAYSISMAVPFTVANPPVYLSQKEGGVKLVRRSSLPRDIIAPMYN